MRNAFAQELLELAKENPSLVLLSGDIGNRLFDPFKSAFPSRFYNCGVAEANMASMAAGMAMCGLRPITYTITPFNTTRCLEQIRDDICYHNASVLIIGTGAGLSYASLGCTHHSCEDIAFLKSLPNMTVLCPADAMELKSLLRACFTRKGPIYMRIGKAKEPVVYETPPKLEIGKGYIVKKGGVVCLISMGNMLPHALACRALLEERGIEAQVVSMHTVKPLDIALLQNLFSTFSLLVSIEEHSLIGGLGSSIAEWMVDHSISTPFLRIGTPDLFPHPIGSQKYLRERFGLTPLQIFHTIYEKMQKIHLLPLKETPLCKH